MKTIILPNEQYTELVNALHYAAEQRHYEADCTENAEDRKAIQSSADTWTLLLKNVQDNWQP